MNISAEVHNFNFTLQHSQAKAGQYQDFKKLSTYLCLFMCM